MANPPGMDQTSERVTTQAGIDREIDVLLLTLTHRLRHPAVADYGFGRLVELLVEGIFIDLRTRFLGGELSRADYVSELAETIDQCRVVGLVPKAPMRG